MAPGKWRILLFGVVGDFSRWSTVPYIVEDLEGGKRIPQWYTSDEGGYKIPYISPYTLISLYMHTASHYDTDSINIVLYVPTSLATSVTAQTMRNQVPELGEYFDMLCNNPGEGSTAIRLADLGRAVAKALSWKLRIESNNILDTIHDNKDSAVSRVKQEALVLECISRILAEAANNSSLSSDLVCISVKPRECAKTRIHVVPVPLALTHVCRDTRNIVTYHLSDAAERLTAILTLDMARRILGELEHVARGKGDHGLLVAIDASHGVNYSSASMLQAYELIVDWTKALIENIQGKPLIRINIYNSDPDFQPTLPLLLREDKGVEERKDTTGAYKIHLVRSINIEPGSVSGYAQLVLSNILQELKELGDKDAIVEKIKNTLINLLKLRKTEEVATNYLYSIISASLGLVIWTLYFTHIFIKAMVEEKRLQEGTMGELLPNIAKDLRELKLRIRHEKDKTTKVDISNISRLPRSLDTHIVLAFTLLNTLYQRMKRRLNSSKTCIKFEGYKAVFKINQTRIHGVAVYSIDSNRCRYEDIQRQLKDVFGWASLQALSILENEFLGDDSLEKEIVYGYMPGGLDARNLLAHAGLSRGAAILLSYHPVEASGNKKKTLATAVLLDTDALRSTLSKIALSKVDKST